MTSIDKAKTLRRQAITLLLIERGEIAERIAPRPPKVGEMPLVSKIRQFRA
jgi:hypothetical protein